MNRFYFFRLVILFPAFFCTPTLQSQITRPAGVNLTGVVDWSTERVFTDAFKQSREWIAHDLTPGAPWSSGQTVPLRADGYPLEIPYNDGVHPPQGVRALMLWDLQGHYPAGLYRLVASGSGRVALWGAASGVFQCPVDTLVQVNPANGGVVLEIEASLAADPVRSVRFIYPDYVDVYQNQTFTGEFLDYLAEFQTIRFMDWLRTNNSSVATWSDRTPHNYFTQAKESGVAWEYIVELCNLSGKNAWINIPHEADDDYIAQLAKLLRDSLDPALTIYLEYSNEVWNSIFSQNAYAADAGQQLGYTGQPWERTWKYTAKRSADIFQAFSTVFGPTDRLVRVVPTQAANPWLSNQILTYYNNPLYNPNQLKADALGIAPYFGGAVADQIVSQGVVNSITISEIVDRVRAELPVSFGWMDEQKTIAAQYGLELLCYEAGQHLVATGANVNNVALTEKLLAANRDTAMHGLYCAYIDHWYAETGGGLCCFFSSHGLPSKWGSWGMKEYMEHLDAPKYLGIKNCVFPYNTVNDVEPEPVDAFIRIFPNPSENGVFYVEHGLSAAEVMLYDVLGKRAACRTSSAGQGLIRIEQLPKGVYFVVVQKEKIIYGVEKVVVE